MKKITTLVLSALMILSLTACGNKDDATETPNEDVAVETPVEQDEDLEDISVIEDEEVEEDLENPPHERDEDELDNIGGAEYSDLNLTDEGEYTDTDIIIGENVVREAEILTFTQTETYGREERYRDLSLFASKPFVDGMDIMWEGWERDEINDVEITDLNIITSDGIYENPDYGDGLRYILDYNIESHGQTFPKKVSRYVIKEGNRLIIVAGSKVED